MNAADFPRVGLADAIERLSRMPALLEAALATASPDELLYRPGDDAFSLTEHACHLRDLEREGYLVRMRRILDEEVPVLEPFEGERVARELAAARARLVSLAAPLGAAQLAREAIFEGKRICLVDLIAMIVEHDRGHREEIETLAETLESP
jgi:hypothetical protein